MLIVVKAGLLINGVSLFLALAGWATGSLVPEADTICFETLGVLAFAASTLLHSLASLVLQIGEPLLLGHSLLYNLLRPRVDELLIL